MHSICIRSYNSCVLTCDTTHPSFPGVPCFVGEEIWHSSELLRNACIARNCSLYFSVLLHAQWIHMHKICVGQEKSSCSRALLSQFGHRNIKNTIKRERININSFGIHIHAHITNKHVCCTCAVCMHTATGTRKRMGSTYVRQEMWVHQLCHIKVKAQRDGNNRGEEDNKADKKEIPRTTEACWWRVSLLSEYISLEIFYDKALLLPSWLWWFSLYRLFISFVWRNTSLLSFFVSSFDSNTNVPFAATITVESPNNSAQSTLVRKFTSLSSAPAAVVSSVTVLLRILSFVLLILCYYDYL